MSNVLSISRREWRWVLVWSTLIVLITSLPALVAWWKTPEGWYYTGQLLSPADGNTYLNKMKQGADGQWLFSIAYTSEPHEPTFLHPYYILLGHLSRLAGLPLGVTFQLFRAINSWLLLLAIYLFIAELWRERVKRQIGFLFVASSAGLGWIFVFLHIPTTDINVPEANTFSTMLTNPHFPLATALVVLSLLWGMRGLHNHSWRFALLSGLGQTGLLLLHPYDIVITGVTLAIYFILGWSVYRHWSWRAGKYLGLMWLVCLPAFLHNFSLYMRDGVWRQWQTQSPPPTPPPADFILGYGFLLALATVGGYAILRQNHSRQTCQAVVLVVWIISVFILLFAPIPPLEAIQVRFSEGLHIPIAILATEGLFAIFANMAGGKVPQKRVWVPLLILLSLTNWLILVSAIWRVNIPESPWFYTQDEVVAMRWLDNHSQPTDVVLTLDWTGNYLPAQANVHVYVGHLYETIDFSKKVEQAAAFFSNSVSEVEAANFLKENNIGWVFVGHQESDSAFNPGRITCLKKAFEHGAVSVYRVNLP